MTKTLAIFFGATLLALTGAACSGGPSDAFCDAYDEFEQAGTEGEGDLTVVEGPLNDMLEAAPEDVASDIETVQEAFQEVVDTSETAILETDEVTEAIDGIDSFAGGC